MFFHLATLQQIRKVNPPFENSFTRTSVLFCHTFVQGFLKYSDMRPKKQAPKIPLKYFSKLRTVCYKVFK